MDNKKLMEQLRKIVREVIQEELKHGKSAYDSKTNISATELKDKEGKTVGYIKHTRDDRGGLVAAGRIGPKAAKAVTGGKKETALKEGGNKENKEKKKEAEVSGIRNDMIAKFGKRTIDLLPPDALTKLARHHKRTSVTESSDDEKGKEEPKKEPKKDKPMTVIKPEEMTPYQHAVAAYYASKGPGEYTGD